MKSTLIAKMRSNSSPLHCQLILGYGAYLESAFAAAIFSDGGLSENHFMTEMTHIVKVQHDVIFFIFVCPFPTRHNFLNCLRDPVKFCVFFADLIAVQVEDEEGYV